MEGNRKSPLLFQRLSKGFTALVLIAMLGGAIWLLSHTQLGGQIRHRDFKGASELVHRFVHHHRLTAPLVYLAIYIPFAVLALPIWPFQLLAGVGFGLYEGILLSVIGSTVGSTITVFIARWIAGDWFRQRVESRMEQLKKLDELLGHNGFLFVMTVRLIPFLPFGLFNYALGLSQISYMDIILGTALGTIPPIFLHVAVGAHYNPMRSWGSDIVITCLTLVLLTPLILRYLRPQWFKKIGVE